MDVQANKERIAALPDDQLLLERARIQGSLIGFHASMLVLQEMRDTLPWYRLLLRAVISKMTIVLGSAAQRLAENSASIYEAELEHRIKSKTGVH